MSEMSSLERYLRERDQKEQTAAGAEAMVWTIIGLWAFFTRNSTPKPPPQFEPNVWGRRETYYMPLVLIGIPVAVVAALIIPWL